MGIFATQSSVNQSNNLKHRQFINSLVKLEFTGHFGVASQLFLGFLLKNSIRQSERVRVKRREWDLWEAWWRLILIELLRSEGQRVEASEVDTTFPLFSQWCQVGRGGSAGGRIDAINANYWGGRWWRRRCCATCGRRPGPWQLTRRTEGGCSEQLTAARDTWAEASCRTGLPISNNNKTHFLCCERKRETRRLTL